MKYNTTIKNIDIQKIVIFTRHDLTEKQLEEIAEFAEKHGLTENDIIDCSDLAKINIKDSEEGYFITRQLIERDGVSNKAIFGVIPTIVRKTLIELQSDELYDCYILTFESHNVQRSIEGEKPTFGHSQFYLTGIYKV